MEASYEGVLKGSYESMLDAYDNERYGHADVACAQRLIDDKQYDKAIPYLWCASPHCVSCPGDGCSSTTAGLTTEKHCLSECYTLLGFAERKKPEPDFLSAERYYRKALKYRPTNCGALAYLTEFYLQTTNKTWAEKTLKSLCSACYASEFATVNKTLSYFVQAGYDLPALAACGTEGSGESSSGGGGDDGAPNLMTWLLIGGGVGLLFGAGAGAYVMMAKSPSSVKIKPVQRATKSSSSSSSSSSKKATPYSSQPGSNKQPGSASRGLRQQQMLVG